MIFIITQIDMSKNKKLIFSVLSVLFWIGVWFLASFLVGNRFFLPSPIHTVIALFELLGTYEFYKVVFFTLLRVICGLLLGVSLGVSLGILSQKFPTVYSFASLPMSCIKATPVASFIILLWVLLSGDTLAVLVSTLMVTPIVWQNTCDGFSSVSGELLEVANLYKFSFFDKLKVLYLPMIYKFIYPSIITSVGLAWKAEIATEIIAYTRNSIGQNINDAKTALLTPTVFAWTLVIVIMSILLEFLASRLFRRTK